MWNILSPAFVLTSNLFICLLFPFTSAGELHKIEKRQVGVLARTGHLPQGKRSVAALARNGELPAHNNNKREANSEYLMDLLIQELAAAEGLNRLHLQALQEESDDEGTGYDEKRSLASLARSASYPNKRSMDALARTGYLLKPIPEVPEDQRELLEQQDFLGKEPVENVEKRGVASLARHGYFGKGTADDGGDELDYLLKDDDVEEEKRNVGAARNFLLKRNVGAAKNFEGKRNIGAARNFLYDDKRNLGSARNFAADGKRNIGAARNFITAGDGKRSLGAARNFLLSDDKRSIGAAKNFFASGIKKNLGSARNFFYGKRNIGSFARDGGFTNLRYTSSKKNDLPWDDDEDFDFDDFHEEDKRYLGSLLRNQINKRYLGALARSQGMPYSGKRNLAAFRSFGKRSGLTDEDEIANMYVNSMLNQAQLAVADEQKNADVSKISKREIDNKTNEHHTRSKREIVDENQTDEYPLPVLQATKENEYPDAISSLRDETYNNFDKRFLD